MAHMIRAVVAAFATTLLLVGCQPSAPPSTSSTPPKSPTGVPTPTFMCTPEAGGAESQCTQAQFDEMKAKDALYAEAEAVYRRFFAENIRISRAGGVEEPTEVMLDTSTGQFLDDSLQLFRNLATKDLQARGEDPAVYVRRAVGVSKEGSIIAILVCVDATRWAFYTGDKPVTSGRHAEDRVYLTRIDGTLKMNYVEGRRVKSCA